VWRADLGGGEMHPVEEQIRAYARERRLRPDTERRLLALAPADAAALLDVVAPLRLGDNQLRDVVDAAESIAARRGASLAAVFADPAVGAVLARDLGRSDRIKALKVCLHQLRYPQLSAALDRLARLSAELGLPRGARLEFPELLEGDSVTLSLRAASAAELRAVLAGAARAAASPQCEEIFAILGGAE
jgi:hypothetical protein